MTLTAPNLTIKAIEFTCNRTKHDYRVLASNGENKPLRYTLDLVKNLTLNKKKEFTRIELANRFKDVTLCNYDPTKTI